MPYFDPAILFGQLLVMAALGALELWGLAAAIPAFVCAAYPVSRRINGRYYAPILIALAAIALALEVIYKSPMVAGPVFGVVAGLSIRWVPWIRSRWLAFALLTAAAVGVVEFSQFNFGQDNCWP
jgi:hypothetical protein